MSYEKQNNMEEFLSQIKNDISEIEQEIKTRLGKYGGEGSASLEELEYLHNIAKRNNSKMVAEVGFNMGFSSIAFLYANPEIEVVSFDIGSHPYVDIAKEYIDKKFPGRHTLIKGNSIEELPKYAKDKPSLKFDSIFIDGGHDPWTAWTDIKQMKMLAHKNTDVIIDDLVPWLPWGAGPTFAWWLAKVFKVVDEKELYKDGKKVHSVLPPADRAWACGKYIGLE